MHQQTPPSPSAGFVPADSAARTAISEQLEQTLFVEASAGTGKTTSLVERVVNLVATGKTTLDRIAAITFTESAAAELRDRIRQRLEEAADDEDRPGAERHRCRQGTADLDQASIRTLHAFAAQLLYERPLEAGLPPAFETTDEISAGIRFNEAWNGWLDVALRGDSPLAGDLSLALTLGMTLEHLKDTALQFHRNYSDLRDVSFGTAAAETTAAGTLLNEAPELDRLCQFSKRGPGDPLHDHVRSKLPALRRLAGAEPGTPAAYRLLRRVLPLSSGRGNQRDWDLDPLSGRNACSALKALLKELNDAVVDELGQVRRASLLPLLSALRGFALEYADERKAQGRAEFHDLLVWARDLLRDNLEVRDHFRSKFSHLLIDEAQDTDPIQAEIALFLAESVSGDADAGPRPTSWREITPEQGKLFVVGDPKQSIYRFRRADVIQMVQLQQLMEHSGGSRVSLVQNFRSQETLVDWVNHVFGRWMDEDSSGEGKPGFLQAVYEEMYPRWKGLTAGPFGPKVWALANEAVQSRIDPVREQESQDIAALLKQISSQGWLVLDQDATRESGEETYRPARYSDVCILMPRRTALRTLERGLESASIPYRLESASLIFESQEIRDLLNCLKAIDNPADQVATVAALRSPAFGCSDVELLQHHRNGGRFNCLAGPDRTPEGPVGDSLAVIRHFHEARLTGSTGALIDRFVRERMLMEVAIDHPQTRGLWRRYRFLVERAWQFEAAGGKSLRAFVEWVEDQISERARVTEAPVPESDEEAVRVMTIHAAKGLEFPIVILTGINSGYGGNPDRVLFDRIRGRVEVGLGSQQERIATDGYEELAATESDMGDAEDVRLMYVAATRARDHLVLSLRRTDNPAGAKSAAGQLAGIVEEKSSLWNEISPAHLHSQTSADPDIPAAEGEDPIPGEHSVAAFDQWGRDRESLVIEMGRPSAAAATALGRSSMDGEDKPEQESPEPWRRGRAGTSVGRAVHAVLQSADLGTGDGIAERARAQAAAEGVPGREQEIAGLCQTAVESGIVKRAVASGRYWREVPVAVGTGGGSLHGFIDLLFEEADGLVVVDYKTDSVSTEGASEAVQRYRLQGGAYAHALQQLTGRPVREVVFLYLQPSREEVLPDLQQAIDAARAEAEALLGAETD